MWKRFHKITSGKSQCKCVGAYLSSSVKTNFLSLRSLNTIPLECASWTAATICRKSGRAWGSRNRRFVLKIKLISTLLVVNEHFAKWKLNHSGFDGFSKIKTRCYLAYTYSSVLNWSHMATIWNISLVWIMSFSQICVLFGSIPDHKCWQHLCSDLFTEMLPSLLVRR